MRRAELNDLRRVSFIRVSAIAVLLTGVAIPSMAQQQGQKTFSSAQDAMNALVSATKNNDQSAMIAILGPDADTIVSSGDKTEDADDRANFVQKYDQMHRLVREPDGDTTLYIGAENWPMPIPLVKKDNSWYFDTEAGRREILYRRVGENEASAIRVCEELVSAEKEYDSTHHEYAQKIFSDQGEHNGLYWGTTAGEPESPIGPLVALAVSEGYAQNRKGVPTAYRGYYFHVLKGQGADAAGGAKSYISDGKMTGGFAFVAYPAMYRSSGVMTFVVDKNGVVYQKDLGKQTDAIAKAMKEYNPNTSWKKSEDQQEEATAQEQHN